MSNGIQTRVDIVKSLRAISPVLDTEYGITSLALFGSYARQEPAKHSDVDILILNMRRKNGLTIARAQRFISDYLHLDVDLGLYDSLRPYIKSKIQQELVYV